MTDVKLALLLCTAAVLFVAVALYRQRALGRGGLVTAVVATLLVFAAMFLGQ